MLASDVRVRCRPSPGSMFVPDLDMPLGGFQWPGQVPPQVGVFRQVFHPIKFARFVPSTLELLIDPLGEVERMWSSIGRRHPESMRGSLDSSQNAERRDSTVDRANHGTGPSEDGRNARAPALDLLTVFLAISSYGVLGTVRIAPLFDRENALGRQRRAARIAWHPPSQCTADPPAPLHVTASTRGAAYLMFRSEAVAWCSRKAFRRRHETLWALDLFTFTESRSSEIMLASTGTDMG